MNKKRIIITGKNGYVASNIEKYLLLNGYDVTVVDLLNKNWKNEYSFYGYDVLIHTAGLVHKKEKKYSFEEYYKVNSLLTKEVALKAKEEKVGHFIFMSSESVYGISPSIYKKVIINFNTPSKPKTKYGKSKLIAEQLLREMINENFYVLILRCPMIYGNNCRGNYDKLVKLVNKIPFFPNINNQRSFLNIDILCSMIPLFITNKVSGYRHPQNTFYMSTTDLVKTIKPEKHKKVHFLKILNVFIYMFGFIPIIKKIFGNMILDFDD